jgi:nitroreductase
MVRSYRPTPIDPAVVDRILDAARGAPSAGFSQGVELVVVTSEVGRRRLAAAAHEAEFLARGFDPWLSVAPVHIVIACDPDAYRNRYGEADKTASIPPDEWTAPYWWVDAGAVLMMLLLAAEDEDLGAGFLGSHAFDDLAEVTGIPAGYETVGLVTVGHAAEPAKGPRRRRRRRPLAEIEHSETWGVPRRNESGE